MPQTVIVATVIVILFIFGIIALISRFYKKAKQGQALVRTGIGGVKVSFSGMLVIPVLHKLEVMDISLKSIVISREGKDGLVCKDNMRADIKMAFFVRVNESHSDVKKVAQSVGCERASSKEALNQLFEAKFSEALKTVGKQFDFVELYTERDKLRSEIIQTIGKNLNGYIMDDAAIDYLEQTPIEALDEANILDAEGIKKIIDLTAKQKVQANLIERDKEKIIRQQDVEAREAILELDRQLAEKEEKQKREIATVKAREEAEAAKVQQEERVKSEKARIAANEELLVKEQNKQREVLLAQRAKEKADAVELERVEKDRALEATEREKIVTLAQIEKEKSVEQERKNIQEVIRERVAIEKTVVQEEEKIKDTRALAAAERQKTVAVKKAEESAQAKMVERIKQAEAEREAAEYNAKKKIIDAEAEQASAIQKAEAIKILAEAEAVKEATHGKSEAQVIEAKAFAKKKDGEAHADIIRLTAEAEADGISKKADAQAEADKKLGHAEAEVKEALASASEKQGTIDAKVIELKAQAMQKLDGAGKEHEEFKLRLAKEKEVDLAKVNVGKDIAFAQADVMSQALKSAKIDIVGGEQVFFDKLVGAIGNGKMVDRFIDNSETLSEVKSQLLNGGSGNLKENIQNLIKELNISSDDVKNLTVSALLYKMISKSSNGGQKGMLEELYTMAKNAGLSDLPARNFINN
ncbi:MAG: flotillin family protein [Flavobacteriales bacterium]|nr:flotillin family protein [Flavobacteriales bacterium]